MRPGLIVGPYDPTDRFAYWVARFTQPGSLGERDDEGGRAGASRAADPADRRARSRAMEVYVSPSATSPALYNAISPPRQFTMGDLVDALLNHGNRDGPSPTPAWIDLEVLRNAAIEPWTELPLWLPEDEEQFDGFYLVDDARANETGLTVRPLAATVADTAAWLGGRRRPDAWQKDAHGRARAAALRAAGGPLT